MRQVAINIEITEIRTDSCEVMIIGVDHGGEQCVVDAQQVPWPIPARTWRPMLDATRAWLTTEALPAR